MRLTGQRDRRRATMSEDPLQDRMVTPARSVFGTRLPRPTGVGKHLIVVFILSLVALGIAIGFAERDTDDEAAVVPAKAKK